MADTVIANPTYIEHVRHFFEDVDLEHMFKRGYDLTTYPTLKANAQAVIDQTRPPEAAMPPEPERKWSQERFQSFQNWVDNGFPLGTVTPVAVQQPAPAERMRKDARDLSDAEQQTLAGAFQGLMDRDPDDPTSYFAIAGQHWYPNIHCHHHDDRYHPWHRAYIRTRRGRAAVGTRLRRRDPPVLGHRRCATGLPVFRAVRFLYAARDIHIDEDDPAFSYPAGYRTSRFAAGVIKDNVAFRRIPEGITGACRERGVIDLDFRVDADAVVGRNLTAEIELLAPGAERIGRRFPLRAAGDPTINARLLLQDSE